MAKKTALESLALSEKNSLQAKKNIHRPRLGPSGYKGKEEMFRKMEEEAVASGNTKSNEIEATHQALGLYKESRRIRQQFEICQAKDQRGSVKDNEIF